MVARINGTDTFDSMENEILFTRAAMKVDPDAVALLGETDGLLAEVDAARAKDREFRIRDMDAMAARAVANVRLDIACVAFGKDLLHAVGDRKAPRFVGFFPVAPSRWVRQPLDKQIASVQGWLTITGDAVVEEHRAALGLRVANAAAAQVGIAALAPARGLNWEMRRALADSLTRQRDGLHRGLAELAEEKSLPRDWADTFFRVEERESAPPAPTPPPT